MFHIIYTVICSSVKFLWYGIEWYSFVLSTICDAMFVKHVWYSMLSYGMACYEIWGNVPYFTEEF